MILACLASVMVQGVPTQLYFLERCPRPAYVMMCVTKPDRPEPKCTNLPRRVDCTLLHWGSEYQIWAKCRDQTKEIVYDGKVQRPSGA